MMHMQAQISHVSLFECSGKLRCSYSLVYALFVQGRYIIQKVLGLCNTCNTCGAKVISGHTLHPVSHAATQVNFIYPLGVLVIIWHAIKTIMGNPLPQTMRAVLIRKRLGRGDQTRFEIAKLSRLCCQDCCLFYYKLHPVLDFNLHFCNGIEGENEDFIAIKKGHIMIFAPI